MKFLNYRKDDKLSTMFDNEVAVLIDGKRFRYWSRIKINLAIDNIATTEIEAPFDPDDWVFTDTFKPLSYKPFGVSINDKTFFTGTMVPVNPKLESNSSEIAAGAYSLPGILTECSEPITAFPLELKKQNLRDIAVKLLKPFNLVVDMRGDPGSVFDKVAIKPENKVLPFLVELAQQRGYVISSSEVGDLVFWRAVEAGEPVALLEQGMPPMTRVEPAVSPAEYYSEITGVKPIRVRSKTSKSFTVKNSFLPGIFRPFIFSIPQGKDIDLEQAVRAKTSRMYANVVAYSVDVATWRDSHGELWAPNTVVRLRAPGAMVYDYHDFIIRSVAFEKDKEKEMATLDLMLPGSFGTTEPGGLPWER